ncbi:MAG TPA: SDR family oxidoreductase [Acidimicrobiales bacterium]|nr:SDR family oxidoreductase [Acidimicrobiales bacterium]
MGELSGKVAFVTGGSAGIGRAAAMALAAEDAAVVVADVDSARGSEVATEIRDKGGRALFVRTDVSDDAQVAAAIAETVRAFGGLDLAFNNAGIEGAQAITHECTPENWTRTLTVNLTGVWQCMRHEIPAMLKRGGGSIVNNSSVAGLVGFNGIPAYAASKHGILGLTKTAALEYAEQGIRVNAVCPGVIDTEMIERFTGHQPDFEAALLATEPVGRLGRPEEIADAVVWLCSSRASFVTGQAIAVDGGFVAR